jgi:hypothetical protein
MLAIAVLLAASACQRTAVPSVRKPAASAPIAASASATPKADRAATTAASPMATEPVRLVPPPASTLLQGVVTVDAGYLIANNGGSIIASGGAGVVVVGPYLISDASGGFTSSGLVSDHGAGLVSNNGGGLMTEGTSASLIGKAKYAGALGSRPFGLLEATDVPLGTQLPAAGMEIEVESLADGKKLGILQTEDGTPVETIQSDDQGRYNAYVPTGLESNVRVVARLPKRAESPSLQLELETITAPRRAEQKPLDDETAQGARYMRVSAEGLIRRMISNEDVSASIEFYATTWKVPAALRAQVADLFTMLHDAAVKARVPSAAAAQQDELAKRLVDVMLSSFDLEDVMLDPKLNSDVQEGEPEPALAAFVAVLRAMREGATLQLQADATHFDKQPYLIDANQNRPSGQAYRIRRPADLGAFVVDEYFAKDSAGRAQSSIRNVLLSVNADTDPKTGFDQARRMVNAAKGLGARVALAMASDEQGSRTRLLQLIEDFGKNH